jgi:gliding motility-associated-like protein
MKHFSTLLLFFLFNLLSMAAFSQGEGNIWYFGGNAGLDFNSGTPVVLTNSAMNAFEGCSSIADENGDLLFYTDGMTIWNANHQVMFNGTGLYGNSSTTQSGVIIPLPGSDDVYYVFTCDAQLGAWGLRYSIVDMSLQSGLGEVTDKNIPVYTPSTEKITATSKSFSEYWVMTHQWNNNTFAGYVLDANGLSATATTSSVGTIMNGSNASTIGYMKFSPDGNRLGYSIDYDLNRVEVFDFNKTTGEVSNSLVLGTNFPGYGPYGFEFSPNSQVVYMANEGLSPPLSSHVYQWDLQAGTSAQIIASVVEMGAMDNAGALQLGPDGKIYLVQTNTSFVGVINEPDVPGTGCDFQQNAINMSPGSCNYGLPNFVTSLFLQAEFSHEGICFGDTTFFTIVDTSEIDSVKWIFDDPASGSDVSTEWAPYHIFSEADTFTVQLYYFFSDTLDTAIVDVIIYPLPPTDLGADTAICLNDVITLDASYPYSTYLWMDGSTDSTLAVSLPGLYYVEVTSVEGCINRDSLLLTNHPLPVVDLGNDTLVCDGQILALDVSASGELFLWQDGSVDADFTVASAGLYWVFVTDSNACSQADSIVVNYVPVPPLDLGADTAICLNDTLTLSAYYPNVTYLWNNGTTNPDLKTYTTGIFWAQITDTNQCVSTDTFNLSVLPPPPVDLGDEIHYCIGQTATMDASGSFATTYLWYDGSTASTKVVATPGIYWVETTNSIGCLSWDTVEVFEEPLPVIELGTDTLLCNDATLLLDAANDSSYHDWQDGSNTATYLVTREGDYSVTVIDKYGCISTDEIHVEMQRSPYAELGPDELYCYGDSIRLNAWWPDASYAWNTGSTDSVFYVFMVPGLYRVDLINECGVFSDSVMVDFHNCQSCVNVPNVFTPNADGRNDLFIPHYDCSVGNYTLKIFNRWGQQLFESHNINDGWDGRNRGTPSEIGSYAWHLEYVNLEKPEITYELKGYVVLLR